MATRYYFQNLSTGAPVSPAFDANWSGYVATPTGDRTRLIRKLAHDVITTIATRNTANATASATGNELNRQFVGDPLRAQTIAGNFSLVVKCSEGGASGNATLAAIVRVVSNDGGTFRGTLLSVLGTDTEFGTSAATRILGPSAVTSLSIQDGDRLVVEVGVHRAAAGSGFNAGLNWGTSGGTDYALTTALVTDLNPWCEFSQDLYPLLSENYRSVKAGDGMSVGERIR